MKQTVCGYCGVGCGLNFNESKLSANSAYPSNKGLICKKGLSGLESINPDTRLLRPAMRSHNHENFQECSWDAAMAVIAKKIAASTPERVGFYLSGQMLTEDYYVANKLAKGFIGTANVDTNSRTCMASAVVAYQKVFGLDYVPVRMDDIAYADLLILAGSNAAESHVVFHNRIKKARKKGLKVVVIDPRRTLTAEHADLHVSLRPGSDIDFFSLVAQRLIKDNRIDHEYLSLHVNGFEPYAQTLKGLEASQLLERCDITADCFEAFMQLFYASGNIISAWTMGLNQSVQGVDKNLALINVHLLSGKVDKKGNGLFSLTGQPNAMGGREVGGLSTTLAVHRGFDAESVAAVSSFWNSDKVPTQKGLTAYEMVEAAERGELEVLIICHTDPIYHLPHRTRVEAAFEKIPFVVEINAYDDSQSKAFTHLRLPATPWGEKEGTQTNMDRSVTRQEILATPQGEAKADWQIFCMIATALGCEHAFAFESAAEVFTEYQSMCRISKAGHLNLYEIDQERLKERPFVWGQKLYEKHRYFTPDGKAQMHVVLNRQLSESPSEAYPFVLLTGRIRDQWHSATKTLHVSTLLQHKPLEFVEIHPDDAAPLGITNGQSVRLCTPRGSLTLPAVLTEASRRGSLFIPVTIRGINYLTNDRIDAQSKQPDYNHSCAMIQAL